MLEAFAHETGAHCGSTSLFDVATFGDWGLPEPWCFGIGGGLGFSYYERDGPRSPGTDAQTPTREFVGRTPWLEASFFAHLGVDVAEHRGGDAEEAYDALQSHLDAGRPVIAFVDIFHLPYFGSDVHFSPHVVVVVDADADGVTIADSEFETVQHVARADFDAAWSSDVGFFGPLDRRLLAPRGTPERDTAAAMRDGIEAVADGLLEPASAYDGIQDAGDGTNGIEGMRAMARELPSWREFEDAEWCTRFAYQNVEKRGTGGAAFRGLFEPFLTDARDRLDAVTDGDVAEFREIECDWHDVGAALKRAGLADDPDEAQAAYETASATLFDVADREEALFETLRARL